MYEDRPLQRVARFVNGKVVISWEPPCDHDPCDKHGTCHCECRCMPDGGDNCRDCAEAFDE